MQVTNIFLRNVNLLDEIEQSKLTYCCFDEKKYTHYDIEFVSFELMTPEPIAKFFNDNPLAESIIIRVQTDEHIANIINKDAYKNLKRMIPFKHFLLTKETFINVIQAINVNFDKINEYEQQIEENKKKIKEINGEIRANTTKPKDKSEKILGLKSNRSLYEEENNKLTNQIIIENKLFSETIKPLMKEVLRSHWYGETIATGKPSFEHGQITDNLARMIMLLASKYSKAGNWSGYTYIEDMVADAVARMIEVVLKFNEARSDNPFSFLTQTASNQFKAVLDAEKKQRKNKSNLMQKMGYKPSFGEQEDEFDRMENETYGDKYN